MKKLLIALAALTFSVSALAANPEVELKTNQGTIVIELNAEKAPKSVDNFLQYVKAGFYNGTIFHRVIPGFMIQGGGFEPGMKEKNTRAPIPNEAKNGLKNAVGTIAMARTNNPNSATAQFFINVVDNVMLDAPNPDGYGYAVFGRVTRGMDVVFAIARSKTGQSGMYGDVPVTPIVIESAKLLPETK
ncbi:MAG TPA: peptidylprolyl isomerase [Rhodocyclaceae bacterium]